jgi:Lipocalin-like domain
MRAASHAGLSLLSLICLYMPLRGATLSERSGAAQHLTRQELIGVWRLIRIDSAGPSGAIVDPFYQADSTGIIIYESSGWMSVHIVAPHRVAWEVPASRVPSGGTARDAPLKAAAFDTYYAYFGTWDLDEPASVVTHHVKSSLIPAETGVNYAQAITLESGRLVFTTRSGDKGREIIRRKVWERMADAAK